MVSGALLASFSAPQQLHAARIVYLGFMTELCIEIGLPAGALVFSTKNPRAVVELQQPAPGAAAAVAVLPLGLPGHAARAGLQHLCGPRRPAHLPGQQRDRGPGQLVHRDTGAPQPSMPLII